MGWKGKSQKFSCKLVTERRGRKEIVTEVWEKGIGFGADHNLKGIETRK